MAKKLLFNDYSDVVRSTFETRDKFQTFSKLCVDTYHNNVAGQSIDKANLVIRNKIKEVMGLSEIEQPTETQIKKAFKKSSVREALFDILEETLDETLISGWSNDPFFMKYVEFRTAVLGQKNSFYTKPECILSIAKIANGHHNLERQRLAGGSTRSVETAHYGAKVYMEMSRFIQGVEDWTELINAISRAYTIYINTLIHTEVMSASQSFPIPTKWNVKGAPSTTNKAKLKALIADVQRATGAKATIMGTEVALGGLVDFGNVAWASDAAKDDIYSMGRLGSFEGTPIVEIPQAFAYNDVTKYLEDDTKLLIMPANIDKFIKFYYEGADEIKEVSEVGDNGDDTKDYEFKTCFGVEAMTNVRFGCYTLTD